ncbi:hypothetical protein QCA50_008469 [Cerrena zonata]|uniref:Uncharacterized protein n=1 Tax=Cerrena zonata TaxID=2478898 RepID=A0AAW0G9P7_9APHY
MVDRPNIFSSAHVYELAKRPPNHTHALTPDLLALYIGHQQDSGLDVILLNVGAKGRLGAYNVDHIKHP